MEEKKRSSFAASRANSFFCLIMLVFVSILVSGGCGLYNTKASSEKDTAAKTFTPEAKKAVIHVYRAPSLVAAIQAFRIYLDNRPVVDCTSGTFIRLVVEPGTHVIGVGNAGRFTPSEESVTLETDVGELHYVELTVGANPISGIPKLAITDDQTAQGKIRQCDLLELGLK